MDLKDLERRYKQAPITWAILEVLQEFLETTPDSSRITLDDIRRELIECEFEPGLPEQHRILADREPEFVRDCFERVKEELESSGFTFTEVDPETWILGRPGAGR